MMRFRFFVFVLVLVIARGMSPDASAQKLRPDTEKALMCREISRLINLKRSIYNQAPLRLDDHLSKIAEKHSKDMADGLLPLGHDGFEKRDSVITVYLKQTLGTGENVCIAADAEEAVESWWTSEGHKENILGDYNLTGIGLAKSGSMWFCTQIFVRQ